MPTSMILWSLIATAGVAGLAYMMRHSLVRALERPVMLLFHYFYYRDGDKTWSNTKWAGVPVLKLPLDMWRYHDLLWETKPDLIIETGTCKGGSALYMAHLCDLIGKGRIVTVDIGRPQEGYPEHARVTYVTGSSTDGAIIEQVKSHISPGDRVMVILDSDHSRDHVRRELDLYAPLVSRDCYLVVEDTNVNGHPVSRSHGAGPMEALRDFLRTSRSFAADRALEARYKVTFYPEGWLKRVAA